jgi:hypothetical protein
MVIAHHREAKADGPPHFAQMGEEERRP